METKTLRHIVDALAAAKASGLINDTEQTVFDVSLGHAGGIIALAKMAGMLKMDREDVIEEGQPERGTRYLSPVVSCPSDRGCNDPNSEL